MALPLVSMPYVARVLGAEGIGVYSYTYSVAQYFLLFGMLGVENYGNRAIARVRDSREECNRTFSSVFSLQFYVASFSLILYLLYSLILSRNTEFALIQMLYVLSGLFDINWVFWGVEDFRITVTKKIFLKICTVICIFAFVHSKNDLWLYLLILSLGYFVAQSSMWLFSKKYVSFHFCGVKEAFAHFGGVLVLFIPIIATSIYRMMDKIMIGIFCDMPQVGYYENSEKLVNVCLCVISSFGAVMMPRMSNVLARGLYREYRDLFTRSMEIAICIGAAIAFGIGAIAKSFIPVFYGEGYEKCIIITELLSITVIFITWACIIRTLYLIPQEKNRIYISSVLAGAIINLVINLLLIPSYGAVGAAIGTVIAEISVAVVQTISVYKELDIIDCIKRGMPFILFGAVMFFAVKTLRFDEEGIMDLLIKMVVGAIVYIFSSCAWFYKTKNKVFFDSISSIRRVLFNNGRNDNL